MDEKVDARIKRTQHLLREALISLISEKGYEAMTVQDLTNHAMLNRSTFYLHYRDKQDLLYQTARDVLHELRDCFTHDEPVSDLLDEESIPALVHLFEHFAHHAAFYQAMWSDMGFQGFHRHLQELVIECYKAIYMTSGYRHDPSVPVDLIINYLSSAHLGAVFWWLNEGMPYTPRYMAMYLTRLVQTSARDFAQFQEPRSMERQYKEIP